MVWYATAHLNNLSPTKPKYSFIAPLHQIRSLYVVV